MNAPVSRGELVAASGAVIAKGSKSFAGAARLFDRRTRAGVHLLYAWCRHCDDVVDGQELGHGREALTADDRRARVAALEAGTRSALAGEPQTEPVFAGLQLVAQEFGLDARWPIEHIAGFAMDIDAVIYPDRDAVLLYCWRVAGVVGVMMATVMGVDAADLPTLRRAQDLGLAFQLTNIARDVADDARNERVYLPADALAAAGLAATPGAVLDPADRAAVAAVSRGLVAAAEPFYDSAVAGLSALPLRSAWAIAAARSVYREIGRGVVRAGETALDRRTTVGSGRKAWLAAGSGGLALRSRLPAKSSPRPDLWSAL